MGKSGSRNKKRRTKVDRISDLPESLLLHILSFLPLKEAIAASLISKTWKPLWCSLPTLELDRQHFKRLPSFHQFVDKVLKSVDLKSIQKFVIKCDHFESREHFRPRKISKWINAVISNSKVQHLELHLRALDGYELPSSVVIANNIRVLKLNGVKVDTLSRVNLPLLEVLHLKEFQFRNLRCLEMFLSASPFLKDLVVRISGTMYYYPLNIGRFRHLVTAEVPQSLFPSEVFSNATFLRLKYSDEFTWPFGGYMPMFNNLTHLECVADEWTKMVNGLKNFPKLQKLVIYKLGSSSPPEPILDVPPCVSLHLKEFVLLRFRESESESEMIKFMINNARVLRAVYVCAGSNARKATAISSRIWQ